ncbi:MAG TPA: hypothetical protein VIK50_13195 [Gemmatimonadaceae bacterium]
MPAPTPQRQLESFISKYSPEVAREGRAAIKALERLVPGAVRMVYDNYNFLVVGFGPSERASEAVLSLAFAPRWISLCFLQGGPKLPDPHKLLRGSGTVVRNVRLESASDLNTPAIRALITESLRRAAMPIDPRAKGRLLIKSISGKQRPRRPVEKKDR